MESKVCSKCKQEKKVCEFGNSKSSKDRLLYCCKQCNNGILVSWLFEQSSSCKLGSSEISVS